MCVSTQLGCKVGCAFCASGQGKFIRNLTAGEIVEQVARGSPVTTGKKITNVVFMGMGEPLDNFDATLKAVHILIEPWGFAFGAQEGHGFDLRDHPEDPGIRERPWTGASGFRCRSIPRSMRSAASSRSD